jgi:hypothetical protein
VLDFAVALGLLCPSDIGAGARTGGPGHGSCILRQRNNEGVKCAVHATAGVVLGVCAAYNITAACFRRDRHLRFNAVFYSLAVAWELKQTLHHLNALVPATRPPS